MNPGSLTSGSPAEHTATHRLQRLLSSSNSKQKQKATTQQPQPATAAVPPATRDNARTRLVQALQSNAQLQLTAAQQESGAGRWEDALFRSSKSKSAYLSKLANASSQIKRATATTQLELPSTPTGQKLQPGGDHAAADGASPPLASATAGLEAAKPSALGKDVAGEGLPGSTASMSAVHRVADCATQSAAQPTSDKHLPLASLAELQDLMQQLTGAEGGFRLTYIGNAALSPACILGKSDQILCPHLECRFPITVASGGK